MASYRYLRFWLSSSIAKISRWALFEVISVIIFNPLILAEFIWIFIRIFTATNNLEWDNVERIAYTPKKDK
jgi:hypothetical protein